MTASMPPTVGMPAHTTPPPPADPQHAAMTRLLGDARQRLVDTGTRNRLVHVNRANLRANVVNVVNESSDAVYATLTAGRTMRFQALGTDEPPTDPDAVSLAADLTPEQPVSEARRRDAYLETKLGPDALAKRLLSIAREARTAEEEQGVNILYLALGFLTWYEDSASKVAREAPLVLLPVELVRNARSATYDVRLRDDDPMTNLPLQRRLHGDFGMTLPELDQGAPAGAETGADWIPSRYLAQVEALVADRRGWRVDTDGIQLGFFSFAKLLMFLDLDDAAVAARGSGHPLTAGPLYRGFDAEPPLFGDDQRLDPVLPPARLVHVVSADASQTRVIEEVRTGRNLVVQGPPGTGKSQTIANVIAAAARDGKTVLFVAEKMAALSVVHHRLVQVGLQDICLELHSRSASKKAVLAELSRTLNAAATAPARAGRTGGAHRGARPAQRRRRGPARAARRHRRVAVLGAVPAGAAHPRGSCAPDSRRSRAGHDASLGRGRAGRDDRPARRGRGRHGCGRPAPVRRHRSDAGPGRGQCPTAGTHRDGRRDGPAPGRDQRCPARSRRSRDQRRRPRPIR